MKRTNSIEIEDCLIEINDNNEITITEFNGESIHIYELSDYILLYNNKRVKKLKIEVVYEEKGVKD